MTGLIPQLSLLTTAVAALMIRLGITRGAAEETSGPPKDKGPSRMQQTLSKGSPKLTFGVGAVYEAMPSVVFLAAMHEIVKLNVRTAPTRLPRRPDLRSSADARPGATGQLHRCASMDGPRGRWRERRRGSPVTPGSLLS